MAEDILHDELGEGDRVLITHDGEGEELSFEIQKGEAEIADPDAEEEFSSETNGQTTGTTDATPDGGVAEGGSSGGTATATDKDE